MPQITVYRATVFLRETISGEDGEKVPVLVTRSKPSKEEVLDYVKKLHATGIIQAYRLIYSIDGGKEGSWYNDSEVVFLEEGKHKNIIG